VLLRLPYGSQTDPVEGLDFEELDASWTIDDLLWGNPAYAALILMIRQWMDQADTDTPTLLTDLPAYSYKRDGDYRLQPCTKTLLGESEIDHLLQLGLVPLIGSASNNTIKIPWYQHLGSPSGW
jgi:type VI secretion system protein ImpC